MVMNKKGASFGAIVAVIGSILISVGFAWLIAQNWHQIPSVVKILILVGVTSAAFVTGTMLVKKNYQKIGKALFALGSILYTLSIFLIAQIFFTPTGFQGTAWLWLIALVGVLAVAYVFQSSLSLVIGLIWLVRWVVIQFFAFSEQGLIPFGILAFYFLALGTLLYGLNLLHSYKKHAFANIYRWWTAFYFLLFTYVLSFQLLLPQIWPKDAQLPTSAILFLVLLAGIGLAALVWGIRVALKNKKVNIKEILGFVGVVVLLIILVSSTRLVSDFAVPFFGGVGEYSFTFWLLWIIINLFFIALIIGIIGYATWQKMPSIINLGIVFFGLEIFTRYVGFILDFRGYIGLSVFFIIGGILLIGGGYLVEKWRKKLIARIK